jgi:hypothetical protein
MFCGIAIFNMWRKGAWTRKQAMYSCSLEAHEFDGPLFGDTQGAIISNMYC